MAEFVFLAPPVDYPVSGEFGEKGPAYPATGHRGVDYACPAGTDVREMAGGKVHAVHTPGDGWGDGTFGNIVVIDHVGTPWFSGYAHLSSASVQPGMLLMPGAVIGKSGATGKVTGAHLHHQLSKNDGFPADISLCEDPRKFIKNGSDSARIANLEAKVLRLERLLGGYGILGADNRTERPDLFGEPALQYADQRQFSALLSGQLAAKRFVDLTAMVAQLAATSGTDPAFKEELVTGLAELLARLERK